jgi:hypothetical protein
MAVQRGLLRIFWHQALPATLFGMAGLSLYAIFWPDLMTWNDGWPTVLVFVQCLLLAELLGRFGSPAFAFLYSRGHSRDALWFHMMLASVLSVTVAWLPAALIVWTGLRSAIHDHVFQSPCFPILASTEYGAPLVWLAFSPLFIPPFHYTWIRLAQPTKGGRGGFYATLILLLAASVVSHSIYRWSNCVTWLVGGLFVVALLVLVVGGWALHRSLEVRA